VSTLLKFSLFYSVIKSGQALAALTGKTSGRSSVCASKPDDRDIRLRNHR